MTMQIEDYFDFLGPDDIRIKGHRIGIESVLYEYLHNERTAEEIAERFPTLSLEEIHATILYFFANREQVNQYLADWLEQAESARRAQAADPPAIVDRLKQHRAQQNEPSKETV
jgi:uncharacterized protein (DUF433 family)